MRKSHTHIQPSNSLPIQSLPEDKSKKRTVTDSTSADSKPNALPESKRAVDPTRYGDWESEGRCIDF